MFPSTGRLAGKHNRPGKRSDKRQRIDRSIYCQNLLALSAPNIARHEPRLESKKLVVEGQLAVMHIKRMAVTDIAVRVEIARLEN